MDERPMNFVEGWNLIRTNGINVIENYLSSDMNSQAAGRPASVRLFSNQQYSEIYTTVYKMCTQKRPNSYSRELHDNYGGSITQYLMTMSPSLQDIEGMDLLTAVLQRWNNHLVYVKWMERFFCYLDRFYVKNPGHSERPLPSLRMQGLRLFATHLFIPIQNRITDALLSEILRRRFGETLDVDCVRGVVAVYMGLSMDNQNNQASIYEAALEQPYLENTRAHYVAKCRDWLPQMTVSEFQRRMQNVFISEEDLWMQIMDPSNLDKLRSVLTTALLQDNLQTLLEKDTGVHYLLQNDKKEDLRLSHKLFGTLHCGLNLLAQEFKKFVTNEGEAKVLEFEQSLASSQSSHKVESSDPIFIQNILDLHDKHKLLISECFSNDPKFQTAMKEAYEKFINKSIAERYSFASFLSAFCDRILKKWGEKRTEDQIEKLLLKLVELFSYVVEKDLFAEVYRSQLAKRLLHGTSASQDAEKNFIRQLKLKCGAPFTSKMEGMLSDLSSAVDTSRKFLEKTNRDKMHDTDYIDFSAQVLTMGHWPTYAAHALILPEQMSACLSEFASFYGESTQCRRLFWIHSLGTLSLLGHFQRNYDFQCNTFHAAILLLFNSHTSLKFEDIKTALGVDESILKKFLMSLIASKCPVLCKQGTAKTLTAQDVFSVNEGFTSAQRKMKIPTPVLEESQAKERIQENRAGAIEAAIVRIMKSRRRICHEELVNEVVRLLESFAPSTQMIKTRIEDLISRDFIKRDASNRDTYIYVA